MQYHEIHLKLGSRSRKLKHLRAKLSSLRPNLNCNPNNIPPNTLCYEYPLGKELELEIVANTLGVEYEWGIGGNTFVACVALGHLLYSVTKSLNTLVITNIADPTSPVGISVTGLSKTPSCITMYQSVCYVGTTDGSLLAINVDNPSSPSVVATVTITSQNWDWLIAIGGFIFASGINSTGIARYLAAEASTTLDNFFLDPIGMGTSQVALGNRRAYFADYAANIAGDSPLLRSFRLGGTECPWINTGLLSADLIETEELIGRHLSILGELICHGATIAAEGDISVANEIHLGTKVFKWSETIADPNGLVTANFSSLFLASDGSVWRNVNGGTTWTAM